MNVLRKYVPWVEIDLMNDKMIRIVFLLLNQKLNTLNVNRWEDSFSSDVVLCNHSKTGVIKMINVKHLVKRDSDGRVKFEIFTNEDFDCVEIRYQYDAKGNLSERLASYNEYIIKTKYCYDSEKRLVSEHIEESYNDKNIASYENKSVYDSDGNMKQYIWGESKCTIDFAHSFNFAYSDDKKLLKKELIFSGGNKQVYDYIYDSSGRMTHKKCKYTNVIYSTETDTEYFYDADGNVIKIICTNADNKQTITDFLYENGLKKKSIVSYSGSMFKREYSYEYDSKGRKIKQEYINQYGDLVTTVFFYDEFDNEIFEFVYDSEDRIIEKIILNYKREFWQYAANNGKLIKHKISSDQKCHSEEYEYDANGNITKEIVCYDDGKKSYTENFYDENSNLIRHIVTATDGGSVVYRNKYNSDNTLIEESLTDADGRTVVLKYSFNSNGETLVEIDNSENANYDIDWSGDLFPKW